MNSCSFLILPRVFTSRVFAAILLAGFATTGASAQTGNVTPSLGSERPANLPQLGTDENSFPGTWIRESWRSAASIGESGYSERAKGPYFLPNLLPVLGAPSPANQAPLAANYPREFAGEPFFMAYGNLAAHQELSAKRVERIARYRTACLALLTELREQLGRGTDASALAGLAAAQTPRLVALEAEAEKIRHDLTHGGLIKNIADDIGTLTTTDEAPAHRADLISLRRLLSAAHFQDGFSPDQRRLLEEMALETQLIIEPEKASTNPAPVFFWPAGARIPAPTNLPPEVAARFDEFQRRKAALKDELRATLQREKSRLFNIHETEARKYLAAQAPRFAELDNLADEIRPALAASRAQEARSRQRDYAAAVLAPGLSPAQRRLLLVAAAGSLLEYPSYAAEPMSPPIAASPR